MYMIELAPDMWIAPWDGDPGRTCVRASARIFKNFAYAEKHLESLKRQWRNRDSTLWRVVPAVFEPPPPMLHDQVMELLATIALAEVSAARGVDPAGWLTAPGRAYWLAYLEGKAGAEARADRLFGRPGGSH